MCFFSIRFWQGWDDERLIDVTELLLEPEPTTDVEESLPRYATPVKGQKEGRSGVRRNKGMNGIRLGGKWETAYYYCTCMCVFGG